MGKYPHVWIQFQLVSCWAVQYTSAIIYFVFSILVLAGSNRGAIPNGNVDAKSYYDSSKIVSAFVLIFTVLHTALNIAECILYTHRALSPRVGLLSALVKCAFWTAYLVLVPLGDGIGGILPVDYVFTLLLLGTSLVQLGFAGWYVWREGTGRLVVGGGREEAEKNGTRTTSDDAVV